MTVTTRDKIPGKNLYELTIQQIGGRHLKQYLLGRHKWDEIMFDMINWQGLGATLDISEHIKCLNYVQLIHDWQNNEQQKFLFETTKCEQQRNTQKSTLTPEQRLLEDQEL